MNSIVEQLENRMLLAIISNGLIGDAAIQANVERGGIVTSVQFGQYTDIMYRYEAFIDLGATRTVWGTTERVIALGSQMFDTQFTYNNLNEVVTATHNRFGEARLLVGDSTSRESYATIWLDDANGNKRPDDGYIRITANSRLAPGASEIDSTFSFETVNYDLTQARFFQYQDADLGKLNDNILVVQGSFGQTSLVLQTVDTDTFVWVGQKDDWQASAGSHLSGYAADRYDDLITSILAGGFQPAPAGTIAGLPAGVFPGLGNGFGPGDVVTALAYNFDRASSVTLAAKLTIFSAADVPLMQVYGNGIFIPDGDTLRNVVDGTDFGLSSVRPVTHTFEVINRGRQPLVFSQWPAITVSGVDAADFQVVRQVTPRIAAAGTSTFMVQFIPSGSGTRTATITVHSNDLSTTPYTFQVFGGTGTALAPDIYEPDGDGVVPSHKYFDPAVTPGLARVISNDGVWKSHSLHRNNDVDWSYFELTEDTDVLIQTTSPKGDLRIYVYNAAGQQVGYDNDSGTGANAALSLHLSKGIYYTRVDEFGNNATVPLYELAVLARPGVKWNDMPAYLDGLGKLSVFGTAGGDTISVDVFGGAVRVGINASQVFFPLADVRSLFINARDGADTIFVGNGIATGDIRGSMGSDAITIESSANYTIFGGDGNDVIMSGAGNDFINGKKGNDIIFAGAGNDYVQGGDGDDVLNGGEGDDFLLGYWGNDLIHGDAGNDTLLGGPAILPPGKTDEDQLFGDAGNDTIIGGPGSDQINGNLGSNSINAIDEEVDTITRNLVTDVVLSDPIDILI